MLIFLSDQDASLLNSLITIKKKISDRVEQFNINELQLSVKANRSENDTRAILDGDRLRIT